MSGVKTENLSTMIKSNQTKYNRQNFVIIALYLFIILCHLIAIVATLDVFVLILAFYTATGLFLTYRQKGNDNIITLFIPAALYNLPFLKLYFMEMYRLIFGYSSFSCDYVNVMCLILVYYLIITLVITFCIMRKQSNKYWRIYSIFSMCLTLTYFIVMASPIVII